MMNQDVMLAILAMDAYNQGQGPDVGVLGVGLNIGTALAEDDREDASASFYAVSYSWNGKTIISYRGTDNASWSGDIPEWSTGLGQPYTEQTWLAASFFQEVTQTVDPASVILTGHSLGSGLAGFVGSIYGVDGVLFDNMAFEIASTNLFQAAIGSGEMPPDPLALEFYSNSNVTNIDRSGLKSLHVDGESLEVNRLLQVTEDEELEWGGANTGLTARQLHSQSLLVLLLYAQRELAGNTHWQGAMQYLLPELFNQGIATESGADQFQGATTIDDTMRSMIAYSAVDEGTRPFGDSAIRALFNDANEVGELLDRGSVSQALQDAVGLLSPMIVQYAGQLAVWKDMSASGKEGFISLEQNLLIADLSTDTWSPDGEGSGTIVGRDTLVQQLLVKALASAGVADPGSLVADLWGSPTADRIDRLAFAATEDTFEGGIPTSGSSELTHRSLYVHVVEPKRGMLSLAS